MSVHAVETRAHTPAPFCLLSLLFVFVCVGCVSCVCMRVFMDDRIELEEIPFYIQAEEEHMEQVDRDRRSNFRQVLSLL